MWHKSSIRPRGFPNFLQAISYKPLKLPSPDSAAVPVLQDGHTTTIHRPINSVTARDTASLRRRGRIVRRAAMFRPRFECMEESQARVVGVGLRPNSIRTKALARATNHQDPARDIRPVPAHHMHTVNAWQSLVLHGSSTIRCALAVPSTDEDDELFSLSIVTPSQSEPKEQLRCPMSADRPPLARIRRAANTTLEDCRIFAPFASLHFVWIHALEIIARHHPAIEPSILRWPASVPPFNIKPLFAIRVRSTESCVDPEDDPDPGVPRRTPHAHWRNRTPHPPSRFRGFSSTGDNERHSKRCSQSAPLTRQGPRSSVSSSPGVRTNRKSVQPSRSLSTFSPARCVLPNSIITHDLNKQAISE
ncbi:hypothetical protein NMY22_g17122 [Coprinellus aureogranulatus]|nr:hypothetical protein NMY22_g17122 [Coprinellus aureogranulatus]